MAKIDPNLERILKEYGEDAKSVWDCHGTWVAYHAAVERMAAKAGIEFSPPQMIVNDYQTGTVVVMVSGKVKERTEWSFGEVSPKNNKNAYPFAMAEKRAKDRVALKLLGFSGMLYSEEEADDFKESKPKPTKSSAALKREEVWPEFEADVDQCESLVALEGIRAKWSAKANNEGWTQAWKDAAVDVIATAKQRIMRSQVLMAG